MQYGKGSESMKNKKVIIGIISLFIVTLLGVAYAFYAYQRVGGQNEIVTGQIYMDYIETNQITLSKAFPETKEEAFERDDNIFNFKINSKNTSSETIYYGISITEGDEKTGMNRIKPEDIRIYLESDGEVLIDGVRYNDWDNQRIYVATIAPGSDETTKNYTLRMWVDENVMISDTNPKADYTAEVWNNSYASLKVNVDGNLQTMNMPLSIETSDTMVENNKAYFMVNLSNYTDVSTYGLRSSDTMDLVIEGTNDDIEFSYKDSLGNEVTEPAESLNLSYPFNKNTNVEVQVFVTPKNDANGETDISITLSKNDERIQSLTKHMNVYGNNFCLNNGFNKLYDCILASDSLASNVSTAKANIEAKGSPNLNQTAPSYTYVEDITEDVTNVYSVTGHKFYFADSYELNPDTGTFRLYNSNGSSVITDNLSDTYQNYYTCGETSRGYTECGTVYRVDTTSVSETTYTITKGDKITYKIASSIRSEVGLYKTEDDYGDSYIFRGDVSNNNVLFGGYYWKIVRTNGDDSIRLIYNGTSADTTGNSTSIKNKTYTYSSKYPEANSPTGPRLSDLTYVGYMYGKNFKLQTSTFGEYSNFQILTKYYWADGYEFDEENEVFRLKKVNLEPVLGTFSEMKDSYETYPYTCKSVSVNGVCQVLLKVGSLVSENRAKVQYISYSSVDKDSTRTNELSSNVKIQLENWYATYIVGKKDDDANLITDYVVDGTFCNDRGITDTTYNSGYLLNQTTYYAPYTRLTASKVSTSLKCNDIRDKFSNTSAKGNGLLTYPVALITADEVALAGGKVNVKNERFYLKQNDSYWTMSPSYFYSLAVTSFVLGVNSTGSLYSSNLANSVGLRPIINISPDALISQGDGSVENPYVLKLA